MSTPLGIAHIAAAQNQKEITANDALDRLENEQNAQASIALADANPAVTLTLSQFSGSFVLKCTGALTAPRNVIVPANQRQFAVINATTGGQAITVKTASGTGVVVNAADGCVPLYCDGTNVQPLSPSPSSGTSLTFTTIPTGTIGSAGTFDLPHPLGRVPTGALIQMYSPGGGIWFQSPKYDASNIHLEAGAAGVSADLVIW